MKCLNCSFVNPEDARFCQECGQPLEKPCPNCATPNAPGSKFCKNCGFSLTGAAATNGAAVTGAGGAVSQVRLERLAANASASLVQKARAEQHLPGERRIVTVLFADVVDSTAMAEQMDPEDWTGIMNRAFDVLTPVIYRYEGTIARLMGDALLAFFGAPTAHEDDSRRAAFAALDMLEAARLYADELRGLYNLDFAIRVGINTGPVVVGEVGSSMVYEYTAMGDAVNLAARMQAAARPMTALVTENTYHLLADAFEFTDLGKIPIKGKSEPVRVYGLGKPRIQVGAVRVTPGLESPLVGREAELSALQRISQAVQAGLGRAALVTGEPGIGKSRLIAEWKKGLDASRDGILPRLVWAEGHSLSYGQGLAYHLLVDLLHSLLGVPVGSEPGAALRSLCDDLFAEEADAVYPYLGHLLSVPLDETAMEQIGKLDPQSLQGQYLASFRRLLSQLASRAPLVLVLDDIHWADPSSIDLMIRLLPLVLEAPILLCLVARPDRESPGWKLVSALREQMGASLVELNLQPLSDVESNRLVSNLLEAVVLPARMNTLIMTKTEGNPLFVEEVIRMLIDHGVLRRGEHGWEVDHEIQNVEIPDNLQSLLMARIDRLPEETRRTLRVAAVIGRQFPVRVLEEVLKRQALEEPQ